MRSRLALLALLAAASAPGCGRFTSHVEVDKSALGRVVVYRNGIAYYERHAKVDADKLTLRVPADKVDDFLKSLTVVDAHTQQALPVSFPSHAAGSGSTVDMTIQLPDKTHHDIVLSYVTESPAWKPSYRVVVDAAGKVDLQGWAIVDNTSGEDWEAVQVGVGSSSALSFRYDLHSIRVVHRETLCTEDTFAKAPPRGGSVIRDETGGEETVLAQLDDADIARPEGHPDVAFADAPQSGAIETQVSMGTGDYGFRGGHGGGGAATLGIAPARQAASPPPQRYKIAKENASNSDKEDSRVTELARSLNSRKNEVTIEGYAAAGEVDGKDKALDRANMLRNQLIEKGVAPAQIKVAARPTAAGQKAGVRLVESKTPSSASGAKGSDEGSAPVGESHFESKGTMNVGRGTSAMVSIVAGKAPGEVVYLYDAEGTHGDSRFAFRAVRFRNPTTSTLEAGPMTVYGAGRFIGEGLTDPIPPGAVAVVPFALDRQIAVDRDGSMAADRISHLHKLVRGVLTAEVQHVRTTKLKITNRLAAPATVLVRHTVRKGWNLVKSPKTTEQFGEARLFGIDLKGGETQTIEIEEATPMTRTVDLHSQIGVDLVRVYLQTAKEDPAVAQAMDKVLKQWSDIARHEEVIASLRERGEEFRARVSELQGQIFSLKLVKTAGPLMVHLQQKMKETSQKVQENTIALVDKQEQLMLAKVRFHDELAELTLDQKVAAAK